ncbi:cysteine dioxygenase type 1 [Bacillus rossius redtenbacheri]|uniref:cysteine dioxygenase type 1 n=1 Tax=Bacillus rossius redtenbacheri TaxID=93214 RepID=UPI002FDEEF9F
MTEVQRTLAPSDDGERPGKQRLSGGGVATLEDLGARLREAFEGDRVNVELVGDLMRAYKSSAADWRKFARFNRHRYTRNLVDEGNGKFNLMLLCWGEGQASAVHDHADAHCFMKVLQGSLRETRYAWPQEGSQDELRPTGCSALGLNEVCYINDSLGIHCVENPSHTERAVSLHLYCPPFDSCTVFNTRTGHKTKCPVTFWSVHGERHHTKVNRQDCCPEDS